MRVVYDPDFYYKLKKLDVHIRKSFKEKILLFTKNPSDPELKNHPLKREYEGYKSINITANWRAVYKETKINEEMYVVQDILYSF